MKCFFPTSKIVLILFLDTYENQNNYSGKKITLEIFVVFFSGIIAAKGAFLFFM